MLTKSAKSKGRWLQNWLRDLLIKFYNIEDPNYGNSNIKCAIMGEKGSDIKFSSAAQAMFPFQFECKNLRRFVGYKYYKQAMKYGDLTPIVVIKANFQISWTSRPIVL